MIVGVPKEIKVEEYRVAITPAGVRAFVDAGHTVIIEKKAGEGSQISDAEYKAAGAKMVATIEDVYKTVVFTQENPLSKKPAIFLVSNKIIAQSKKHE